MQNLLNFFRFHERVLSLKVFFLSNCKLLVRVSREREMKLKNHECLFLLYGHDTLKHFLQAMSRFLTSEFFVALSDGLELIFKEIR